MLSTPWLAAVEEAFDQWVGEQEDGATITAIKRSGVNKSQPVYHYAGVVRFIGYVAFELIGIVAGNKTLHELKGRLVLGTALLRKIIVSFRKVVFLCSLLRIKQPLRAMEC
uniref:hypothetical protein n=1 Tax=Piscirickettsia salmonis TaxID=1238 RepID=UPI0039F69AF1